MICKMIKNLIFDLGGVLLTEDDNWLYSPKVKNLLKVSEEKLTDGWHYAWPEIRDGKINEDKFFELFLLASIGYIDQSMIMKLEEIYRSMINKLDAFRLLDGLKESFRLMVLSNIARDWLLLKTEMFDLNRYFEIIITSCNEGIAKPHKEIFLSLIKKANIDPKESLFIDNMEKNIKPAQELGFKTILFNNREQMTKEMRNLGIKI